MGKTDLHSGLMLDLIGPYYERGSNKSRISPDALVTSGVANGPRSTSKVWEEGKSPDLVIEVTSKKNKARDRGSKKGLYEALGVKEYLHFDPTSDYLAPRFQVFRFEGGRHGPVLAPEAVGYESTQLGWTFRVVDDQLRIFESQSQKLLGNGRELGSQAKQQSKRAEQEAKRADQESARAARFAARLRELGLDSDQE